MFEKITTSKSKDPKAFVLFHNGCLNCSTAKVSRDKWVKIIDDIKISLLILVQVKWVTLVLSLMTRNYILNSLCRFIVRHEGFIEKEATHSAFKCRCQNVFKYFQHRFILTF